MIFGPRLGELVRLHYRASVARIAPHHGREGLIVAIGKAPGPCNIGVDIGDCCVVAPRGNVMRISKRT